MEIISWILHKYLFHGPLWFIHKTHHARTLHSTLELNDKEFGLFLILGRKYWRDIFTQLNWFYNIKINTYIFF